MTLTAIQWGPLAFAVACFILGPLIIYITVKLTSRRDR